MRFNFIDILKIEVGLSFEMSRPWRFFSGVTCHSNMSTNSGCVRHCWPWPPHTSYPWRGRGSWWRPWARCCRCPRRPGGAAAVSPREQGVGWSCAESRPTSGRWGSDPDLKLASPLWCDVVPCQECLGGQCRVWPGVVVLVNHLTLTRENRHHHRREHFVDVALCCDAPARVLGRCFRRWQVVHDVPRIWHDGRPSPTVPLHNTRICEALTSTPPHPHTTVGPIYAVAAFVGEDDVLPLSVPPLSMQNSPVVSCNAVSLCEMLSNVRTTTVQMDGDQTTSYRGVGNGPVVGSQCLPGCCGGW